MRYFLLFLFFTGLVFFLFSTFIQPPALAGEILLSPQWVLAEPIESSGVSAEEEGWASLLLNEELLFVHSNGTVGTREQQSFHLSYTENSYVNMRRNSAIFVVKNYFGNILDVYEQHGFPLLFDSGIAIVGPDGLSLEIWDQDGELLLSRSWSGLIAAVDLLRVDGVLVSAVGLLDGRVYLFANGEEWVFSDPPSVLYNLALHVSGSGSSTGNRQALHLFSVEGFNPAMLKERVFRPSEDNSFLFTTVNSVPLPSQPRYSPPIIIVDEEVILGEGEQARKYRFGQGLSQEVRIIEGPGDFQHVWWDRELGIHSYFFTTSAQPAAATSAQSEIKIYVGEDTLLFSSSAPFAATVQMDAPFVYVRNGNILSLYRLEEG